jgi:ectoine hydroxylase-related dioxygenase (phytanoyl-CoA dioxygenase family)
VPSNEDVESYKRDGAIILRKLLDRQWVDLLNQGVDRNIANPGPNFSDFTAPTGGGKCIKDNWAWRQIPEYQEFFRNSPLGAIVGALMEAHEVRFFEDQFFEKGPGSTTPTPWHQDQPYYEVSGTMCITWIPLDHVERDDCLELVAQSHLLGQLFTPTSFSTQDTKYFVDPKQSPLQDVPDIDGHPERYKIMGWEMDPGDIIVFDARTLHCNRGNRSKQRARRISMRWIAENAMYDKNVYPWTTPTLIEGHGIRPGERLTGELFPLVWTKTRGNVSGR